MLFGGMSCVIRVIRALITVIPPSLIVRYTLINSVPTTLIPIYSPSLRGGNNSDKRGKVEEKIEASAAQLNSSPPLDSSESPSLVVVGGMRRRERC